jgi:hypothetical protein
MAFNSVMRVQLRPAGHDTLAVSGDAILGGILDVSLEAGFVPAPGASFEILTAATLTPPFQQVVLPAVPSGTLHVVYLPDRVVITCDP